MRIQLLIDLEVGPFQYTTRIVEMVNHSAEEKNLTHKQDQQGKKPSPRRESGNQGPTAGEKKRKATKIPDPRRLPHSNQVLRSSFRLRSGLVLPVLC